MTANGTTGNLARVYRRVMAAHSALPYSLDPSGRALPAWHYFFEVTRRCNLRCRMCQYRDWFERHPAGEAAEEELTLDEWKGLVDQTSRLSLISFTGGEPWVRGDFDAILAYAAMKRRVHVITNGTLLDEERLKRCIEFAPRKMTGKGLMFLGASIDGTAAMHDAIRGREGAFETTLGALRRLAALRHDAGKRCPMIHVTAVIQNDNLDALPQLPAILAQAGVDVLNLTMEIRFLHLENIGAVDPDQFCGAPLELPCIDSGRLSKTLNAVHDAAARAGIEIRLPDMPEGELLRYHSGGLDLTQFRCRGPWTNCYVGANGDVYPCFIKRIGNVRETSLATLWNGPAFRDFRKRVRNGLFCVCQGCCHLEYAGPRYADQPSRTSSR